MSFSFNIELSEGTAHVFLAGRLIDKEEAQNLFTEIKSQVDRNVIRFVVDLSEMEYMNSSGLNVLVNILTKVRNAGGEMVICSVSERINELLVITKLNTVFSVTDTFEEAKILVSKSMQEE